LTGFVVHRSKVPTFKGVYYINGRMFYIVLSFVGVLLFSGMCRSEMWIKMIIPKNFYWVVRRNVRNFTQAQYENCDRRLYCKTRKMKYLKLQ